MGLEIPGEVCSLPVLQSLEDVIQNAELEFIVLN